MELEARIAMMLGGRVAEDLTFGKDRVTMGASGDIHQATARARRMVTEFGFSERLGPLRFAEHEEGGFLGQGRGGRDQVSEATARIIDREVRRIVEQGEAKARRILTKHADQPQNLVDALLEHETLTGEEVRALVLSQPKRRAEGGRSERFDHVKPDSQRRFGRGGISADCGVTRPPERKVRPL